LAERNKRFPSSRSATSVLEEEDPEDQRERADRQVHEEHPPPREVVDEQPAKNGPERGRQRCRHRQDGRGAQSLGRRERAEQHRHANGRKHAAANSLQHPESN
jgi:hypothetical protein